MFWDFSRINFTPREEGVQEGVLVGYVGNKIYGKAQNSYIIDRFL